MKIDKGSLFYNMPLEVEGGNNSWGTSIGQSSKDNYKIKQDNGQEELILSMVYKSINDIDKVYCPLGKGGKSPNYEYVLASLYDDVYVNGLKVKGGKFVLLLVKEHTPSHPGRLSLKYSEKTTYDGAMVNADCLQKIRETLGVSENGAWWIDEINFINQEKLHFTAYVLDEQEPVNFYDSKGRSNRMRVYADEHNDNSHRIIDVANQHPTLPETPRQVIYYGAPGTGKSHMVDRLTDSENSIRTTFHPDSDYSTFVGAYKPTKSKKPLFGLNQSDTIQYTIPDTENPLYEDTITYNFIPQAFLKAYCKAWQDTSKPFYLVIEEINRGNCAQIFGDLFQLLDRNERFYSSYAIEADDDIHRFLDEDAGEELSLKDCEIEDVFSSSQKLIATGDEIRSGKKLVLPPNLFIYATMNTSDQSLFPIDSAFKRRWDWEYVPIQYNNSDWLIPVGDKNYRWSDFQKAINDKVFHIDHLEDKMMGDWFVVADKDKRVSKHTLINKVLFYLWNDVCKDGEGDIFKMTLSDHKEHDVIFSQFFGEDALVDERLQGLMRYNKVEPVE